MNCFWMVLGANLPVVKHKTYTEAEEEARRLSRKEPYRTFTILRSVKEYTIEFVEKIEDHYFSYKGDV